MELNGVRFLPRGQWRGFSSGGLWVEALKWRSVEWDSHVQVSGGRVSIGAQWNEEWRVVFKWRPIEGVLKWRPVEGVL